VKTKQGAGGCRTDVIAESKTFGENYGFVKYAMELLESVGRWQSVPEADTLKNYDGDDGEVVLDLTTDSAVRPPSGC